MAKGSSSNSGPPPDPNALRRDRDSKDWIDLPAEGRKGRAPAWPLSKQTKRETELWKKEWRRPQAVMWERNGQEVEVALYVRRLAEAEVRGAPVTLANLVRQLQEALGISLPGMARLRWRIVSDRVAEKREEQKKQESRARPAAKDRFKVVSGGGD